jgi:tRNAThr (cytosine32-N3)-methyltransferase
MTDPRDIGLPIVTENTLSALKKPMDRDNFYKMNNANFFKNRRWLNNEFPELIAGTKAGVSTAQLFDEATAPIS